MGISGGQKALMYSLSGVLRAGAGRSGYFPAMAVLSLGGSTVTTRGIKPSIEINEELDSAPNTCRLEVRGSSTFTPRRLQEIIVGFGNFTNRLYAGHVMKVSQQQSRRDLGHPTFALDCIDYSWQLDWKRVTGQRWSNIAPGTIVADIVGAFAPAFTVRVEAGMTPTDFQSNDDERVSEAISRLMNMVNGHWYVDYDRVVHAFVNPEPDAALTPIDANNSHFWEFEYSEDDSGRATRVRVRGGNSTTTSVTAVGSTTLAVDDTRLFASTGGYALTGANQLTYTGKSVTEGPGSLTGIPSSGAGSVLVSIAQGETVRVLAIADDAAAAADVISLIGTGDGYLEYSIQDEQLGDAAARQRAAGELMALKNPDKHVTYKTRDPFSKAGKTVAVDLTNARTSQHISGTFQVQRVVINDIELSAVRYPMRTIDAGLATPDIFVAIANLLES